MIDHSKTKKQLIKEFFSELKKIYKVFNKNLYYIKLMDNEICHDTIIWLYPDNRYDFPLFTANIYCKKKLFGFIKDKELFIKRLKFKMLPSVYFKYMLGVWR